MPGTRTWLRLVAVPPDQFNGMSGIRHEALALELGNGDRTAIVSIEPNVSKTPTNLPGVPARQH